MNNLMPAPQQNLSQNINKKKKKKSQYKYLVSAE